MKMKNERSLFVQLMGYHPRYKVIDVLLDNLDMPLSHNKIIQMSGVSRSSYFKVIKILRYNNMLKVNRQEGRTIYSCLNKDSKIVRSFIEIEKILIEKCLSKTM